MTENESKTPRHPRPPRGHCPGLADPGITSAGLRGAARGTERCGRRAGKRPLHLAVNQGEGGSAAPRGDPAGTRTPGGWSSHRSPSGGSHRSAAVAQGWDLAAPWCRAAPSPREPRVQNPPNSTPDLIRPLQPFPASHNRRAGAALPLGAHPAATSRRGQGEGQASFTPLQPGVTCALKAVTDKIGKTVAIKSEGSTRTHLNFSPLRSAG